MRTLITLALLSLVVSCKPNYAEPGHLTEASFGKMSPSKTVKEQIELATDGDALILLEVETELGTDPKYKLDTPGPLPEDTPHPFGSVKVQLVENTIATSVGCTLEKPEQDVQSRWFVGITCEFQAPKSSGSNLMGNISDDGTIDGF